MSLFLITYDTLVTINEQEYMNDVLYYSHKHRNIAFENEEQKNDDPPISSSKQVMPPFPFWLRNVMTHPHILHVPAFL